MRRKMPVEFENPFAPFSGERFNAVWRSLSESTKNRIRNKAAWEHMSISAAMRGWWPKLWRRVLEAPDVR